MDFIPGKLFVESVVACPYCGNDYLHPMHVDVYMRKEDTKALHVAVKLGAIAIDEDDALNPSKRRDGVRITFCCEHCPGEPVLTLDQCKGRTFCRWLLPTSWERSGG
jgi:hypothetical protein